MHLVRSNSDGDVPLEVSDVEDNISGDGRVRLLETGGIEMTRCGSRMTHRPAMCPD